MLYIEPMKIYKENISPKQMMDSPLPFCRQARGGLLCWTYTHEGDLFPSHPSRVWFQNTAWKEPLIISNTEEWISVWSPVYDASGFFENSMFDRLRQLDNDIDKLYWDEKFGKSGGVTHLLSLLPRPIEENILMDIVYDVSNRYGINLDNNYWFNQRDTIHFWTHNNGLTSFIDILQYQIGLNKIEEINDIIRQHIPTLKPYMDNRQFWQDFFKGTEQ